MFLVSKSSFHIFFVVSLLSAFACSSCVTNNLLVKEKIKRQQKKAKIRAEKQAERQVDLVPQRLPIGIVHMVHPGGEFVLIQSGRNFHLEPGSKITTYSVGGSETAKLEASAASKGEFLTADVISGKPSRGDRAIANFIPPKRDTKKTGNAAPGVAEDEFQVLE